jgi:hypothetical protein
MPPAVPAFGVKQTMGTVLLKQNTFMAFMDT